MNVTRANGKEVGSTFPFTPVRAGRLAKWVVSEGWSREDHSGCPTIVLAQDGGLRRTKEIANSLGGQGGVNISKPGIQNELRPAIANPAADIPAEGPQAQKDRKARLAVLPPDLEVAQRGVDEPAGPGRHGAIRGV